ncbi:MAG: cation diffusion facilitator family transporter [Pseudobdellovibrionaceae bacterium]
MIENILSRLKSDPAVMTGIISVVCVTAIVLAKSVAYFMSSSSAVLSSLVDSLGDIGLSTMTVIALKWSMKPADHDHRFGHGKVEGITSLIQAAVLAGGGFFLVLDAFMRFLNPLPITHHIITLILMAFSIAVSAMIGALQRWGARQSSSLALHADSLHYSADVYINAAVFAVVLFDFTGWSAPWIDPFAALGVAIVMMRSSGKITLEAMGMLMDRELPEEVRSRIIGLVKSHAGVRGMHDLRTTGAGAKKFISFDIEVDANLSLRAAHAITREVEELLVAEFKEAEIMIHIDPEGDINDSRHRGLAGGATP